MIYFEINYLSYKTIFTWFSSFLTIKTIAKLEMIKDRTHFPDKTKYHILVFSEWRLVERYCCINNYDLFAITGKKYISNDCVYAHHLTSFSETESWGIRMLSNVTETSQRSTVNIVLSKRHLFNKFGTVICISLSILMIIKTELLEITLTCFSYKRNNA